MKHGRFFNYRWIDYIEQNLEKLGDIHGQMDESWGRLAHKKDLLYWIVATFALGL